MQKELSFVDVEKHVISLGDQIRRDNFKPSYIVAVARGGWVPARILSNALGVNRILSIGIAYADQQRTKLSTYSSPNPFPQNENILIVEDHLESGRSLEFAKELFENKKNNVKTAALFISNKTVFTPTYYLGERSDAPMFPWE